LRCTALETDKEVPNLTLGGDGIHPDAAGYDALGTVVWKFMQDKGMRR
jgi:lysophospholipase L1-like esterase